MPATLGTSVECVIAKHRRATLRLQPTAAAPALARAKVAALCAGKSHHQRDNALLLTSELVTNAIRHGAGIVTVAIECTDSAVAVAVGDASRAEPRPTTTVDTEAAGGRGLHVVSAIASAWGVRTSGDGLGKIVWFRLA